MTKEEMDIAKRKFNEQRGAAKRRGIQFLFTFEEWIDVWLKSGHWHERGLGKYVMCRKGDTGPYAVDNVEIKTQRENNFEAHSGDKNPMKRLSVRLKQSTKGIPKSDEHKVALSLAKKGRKRIYNADGTWHWSKREVA